MSNLILKNESTLTFDKASVRVQEVQNATQEPSRQGTLIKIPFRQGLKIRTLQEGRQFLLWYGEADYWLKDCWFGGTDEQPFLTKLEPEPVRILENEGEDAFYEALKPGAVHRIEEVYGVPAIRQGDIFAVPLPLTGGELLQLFSDSRGFAMDGEWSVFATRHTVRGIYTEPTEAYPRLSKSHQRHFIRGGRLVRPVKPMALAQGLLEAPDHLPVPLRQVHMLVQMDYLPRYSNAGSPAND